MQNCEGAFFDCSLHWKCKDKCGTHFIRTADNYVDIEEIDLCMLRELIKAIYVEALDKSSGERRQNIHIQYDGIGFIPLEELAKKRNGVTEVTPSLANSRFQAFFKITVFTKPRLISGVLLF